MSYGDSTELRDQMDAWISSMNNLMYEAEKLRGYKSKTSFQDFVQVIYDKARAIKEVRPKLEKTEKQINHRRAVKVVETKHKWRLDTQDHKLNLYAKRIDIEFEYSCELLQAIQYILDEENLLIRRIVGIEYGSVA